MSSDEKKGKKIELSPNHFVLLSKLPEAIKLQEKEANSQLSIDLNEEIKKIYESGVKDPNAIYQNLLQRFPDYFSDLGLTKSFEIQKLINEYVNKNG